MHGPGSKSITEDFRRQIATVGDYPFLGFDFYPDELWQVARAAGVQTVVLRQYHEGILPDYGAHAEAAIRVGRRLLDMGFGPVLVQPLNEPELELVDFARVPQWCLEWARLVKSGEPRLRTLTPPLSGTEHAGLWAAREAMQKVYESPLFDLLAVHFYWNQEGSLSPDAPWGLKWWHGQVPGKQQIIVTECGAIAGSKRSWRDLSLPIQLDRWLALPYFFSAHPYLWYSDDPKWAEFAYNESTVAALARHARAWRAQRRRPVSDLAVCFLPSNQATRTRTGEATYPEYNEWGNMSWLAPRLAEACQKRGIAAAWQAVKADTEPGQSYQHQWIAEQIARANAWLQSQQAPRKLAIHLHTDSGDFSHSYGIHTTRYPESKSWAARLSGRVAQALGTKEYAVFDRLGQTDYNTYLFATKAQYTPLLLELCSHVNDSDIAALYGRSGLLVEAIADELANADGATAPNYESLYAALKVKYDEQSARMREIAALAH